MSFPERPPLPPITCEQIDMLLHKVDEQHWPLIAAMRVKNFYPPDIPFPPQAPEHLRHQINWYARMLFKTEADQYGQFRNDVRYGSWLSSLADRTRTRVMKALDQLETDHSLVAKIGMTSNKGTIMGYHGLTTQGVEKELRTLLVELRDQYELGTTPQPETPETNPSSPPPAETPQPPQPVKVETPRRMPATVHSPSAAAKMATFMNSKGLGQTEFAIQANTTDKTIRKFRQTGTIKRSILSDIAKAMGTSKEDLLS